ncbi:MAG: ABC transporter ATP-binding protein [Bacteroidota bacterium]
MNTLKISNLCKTYANGVKALDDVSLEIQNGLFGLLGPNGAGKSSLMRTIAALQQPDAGMVLFNGVDIVKDPTYIRKQIGYLPQDFGVYPKISAIDLLNHLAILKGLINKQARAKQVEALLDQTNLLAHRNKAVSSFSGGMRQRFGIAQALLGDPKIVIADEPTAGLDPEERNRFHNLLSEIGEQVIVVLSTHIVEDVSNLCTHMAVMNSGRLLVHGEPQQFTSELQGATWEKIVCKESLDAYTHLDVISQRLYAGRVKIHVKSLVAPGEDFQLVTPDLEDVYFNVLALNSPKNQAVCSGN